MTVASVHLAYRQRHRRRCRAHGVVGLASRLLPQETSSGLGERCAGCGLQQGLSMEATDDPGKVWGWPAAGPTK